jgi:hypothetical protein|nr:MAG TPA: hypothetical protein [Caudoviricetes sp.]
MYFKTDKYEGNMVEDESGFRWAETEQGKIPAFIMFEYLQGVLPENILARVFNQSNVMFHDFERRLRREANRYNYSLGDIVSNRRTDHFQIYSNLLDMVGRDSNNCKRIRTYSVDNLTCHKAVGLTEGAKNVVISTKSHKDDWLWIEGEMTVYKNFEVDEKIGGVLLADFLYKYFYEIDATIRNWHTMKVLF